MTKLKAANPRKAADKKIAGDKKISQQVLLPTLKERQRYLVYKVISDSDFGNFRQLHTDIMIMCQRMLGIFEASKAGLMNVKFNEKTRKGIIRVDNKYVDKLRICLGLIKQLENQKAIVDCDYVSGLLNKAEARMNV